MKHKKCLAFFVAFVFCLNAALPVWAANFSDISQVPWSGAETYINKVADAGLMVGDTDTSGNSVFRPKDSVTYCETAQLAYTLLANYYGTQVTSAVETKYTSTMQAYSIPSWAYPACAYCLDTGILQVADLSNFMEGDSQGTSANATRENVALIFGRALSSFLPVNSSASLTFNDLSSISADVVPYLDILVRAGIVSGDSLGNFNPKNTINRSEMAVIVANTDDYLASMKTSSTSSSSSTSVISGIITSISSASSKYTITVVSDTTAKTLSGDESTPCLQNGSTISISSLEQGDQVTASYQDETLVSVIRVAGSSSSSSSSGSSNNTISGTYVGMNNSVINVDVSGRTYSYNLASDVSFVLGGYSVTLTNMIASAEYGDKVTLTLNSNNEITRAVVTLRSNSYDEKGYYKSVTESYITLKKTTSSSSTTKYYFEDNDYNNVAFYVDDTYTTYSKFKSSVSSNDMIELIYGDDGKKVVEVRLIEEEYDEEGYFASITSTYIALKSSKSSSSSTKYYFEDEDSDEVDFYIDGDSKTYSKFKSTVSKNDKIGLVLNNDDEVIEAYLIRSSEEYDEEGFFASISSSYISIKSTKSSSSDRYYFEDKDSDNVDFYIDGDSKSYSKFKSTVDTNDEIGLVLNSDDEVTAVYLIGDDDDEYEEDGYFSSITTSSISIKSSKSSSAKKYYFEDKDSDNVDFYIDGSSKTYSKFKSSVDTNDKVTLVLNDDDEVIEVYLGDKDDDDEYEKEGYFASMSSTYIAMRSSKSSSSTRYYFEDEDSDNVDFYIDDELKNYSKFKSSAQEDDELLLVLNDDDEITAAYLTIVEDTDYDKEGYFSSISSSSISIKSSKSSSATKYYFEDSDSDNVEFFIDDSSKSYSKFKSTVESNDRIGLILNSDDEVTEVYLLD